MSTKTTFKRVALAVVVALGFGTMTSVAPANAVQALSFSLNTTSMTVVGDSSTSFGVFAITVTSDTEAVGLSAGETITASVVGVPVGITGTPKSVASNKTDLQFTEVAQSAVTKVNPLWGETLTVDTATSPAGNAYDGQITSGNAGHYGMNVNLTAAETETARVAKSRIYYVKVGINASNVLDNGVYTLQFDLTNAGGATIQRSTAKIDFVKLASDSGAVVTATSAGQWFAGDTPSIANQSSTRYITATVRNRDGGALRTQFGTTPALSAQITDASTSPVTQIVTAADNYTNERAFSTGVISTQFPNDGNYAIYGTQLTAVETDPTLTVRYGLASATATILMATAATASTVTTSEVVGSGQLAGANAQSAILPLTTKSATVKATVKIGSTVQTGYSVYYTLAYGASCVAGDMTPAKVTVPTKVLTDATGVASVAITNAYPLDGCTATVTWTGSATNPANASVVTWAKPAAASALPNPGGNYQALVKSAQSVSWTIVDQFAAPVVGASVTISHTGANAPTAAPAVLVSDANGKVTYTWTDAKGVAADATYGSDTVKVSTVNAVAPTVSTGAITVTWKSALSTVAGITAYYDSTTAMATKVVVPSTAIGLAAGGRLNSAADQIDLTKVVTGSGASHFLVLQFTAVDSADAAVTGIPTTVTVTNGHLIDAAGKLGTTRTLYANEAFYVVGTKTGVATITATNGTFTKTATILFANASTDARVLSVSEAAGTITATVKDFNGNAVSGVTVAASLTGAGRLGNGATYNTFVTASDGTVSFDVNGTASVVVSLSASTYAKTTFLAGYGDATGTTVTTGAPAGVRSVTVATEGNTVVASAAQGAMDAAAEATDAANAATDAANAAAEAADAATAAAQDAADAVAALSTQVSEMVSALKKQITALTNLVIKIQKKVKA